MVFSLGTRLALACLRLPVLQGLREAVRDLIVDETNQDGKDYVEDELGIGCLRVPQDVLHCTATNHPQLGKTSAVTH